ncbi:MAG: sodium:proton antiporter [Leptospiraceae bacterium]|nr:sodium:proton antiporter [Leptospiraceae bacterium]
MNQSIIIGIAAVIALGTVAQWIAWRLKMPSILILLITGFVAGPAILGFLNPDKLLGDVLFPFVSMSTALILYEGGLSLKLSELSHVGRAVRNLLTAGVLITWVLASLLAFFLMGWDWKLSALFGAILTVTGPTVIIPLLRFIRPSPKLGSILKWEGIVVDPIGALLAVLVFEALLVSERGDPLTVAILGIVKTVVIGGGLGYVAARILVLFFRRFWIPDFLHNPASLMMVLTVYAASNYFQEESGLLAVTVMGVALANQKSVPIRHIIEFKEILRVVLISSLFILLAARVTRADMQLIDASAILFLLGLVFIVRPATVFISTIGTTLNWKDKVFLSWMAPRGIVAAAVTSIFAIQLKSNGIADAGAMVPVMFTIIVGTVALYGISAGFLGRLLGVAGDQDPQGVIIVGGHYWARVLGKILQDQKIRVQMIDTNPYHVTACKMLDLPAIQGNILDESIQEQLDLSTTGRMVALTSNDEVNSLAALRFTELFGRGEVYQISPYSDQGVTKDKNQVPRELRGRCLFDHSLTYSAFSRRFAEGADIKVLEVGKDIAAQEVKNTENITPLFLVDPSSKKLSIYTAEIQAQPDNGDLLVVLKD